MSQIVTANHVSISSKVRIMPLVFTEQGIAMLSSVLKSERAINVNIEIVRTFTKLQEMISSHAELKVQIDDIEMKYDDQFKFVFSAIKQLLKPPDEPKRKIEFKP